jgi:hypothetical protein
VHPWGETPPRVGAREEDPVSEALVHDETPLEFFRGQLLKAMEHQRVSTSAFTEFYLVNLLAAGLRSDALPGSEPGYDETPLALLYVRALEATGALREQRLRQLGDSALFVSGFFAESLAREADQAYYRAMGCRAYGRLAREGSLALGPRVFEELEDRFVCFADLFAEVSESSRLARPATLVKLYERWLATRSRRAALLLAEQGIHPASPTDERH